MLEYHLLLVCQSLAALFRHSIVWVTLTVLQNLRDHSVKIRVLADDIVFDLGLLLDSLVGYGIVKLLALTVQASDSDRGFLDTDVFHEAHLISIFLRREVEQFIRFCFLIQLFLDAFRSVHLY